MGPGWHDEGEGRPPAAPRGGRHLRLRRLPAAGRRPRPNELRGVEALTPPAGASGACKHGAPPAPAPTPPGPPSPATSPLVPTPTGIPTPSVTPTPRPPAALAGNITVVNENNVAISMTITVRGGQWTCGNTLNGQWLITFAPRATSAIHCVIYATQYATRLPQSLPPHTFDAEFSQGSPPRWIHYVNLSAFLPCDSSACAEGHVAEQRGGGQLVEGWNPLARFVKRATPTCATPMPSQSDAGILLRSTKRVTAPSASVCASSSTACNTEGADTRSWRVR